MKTYLSIEGLRGILALVVCLGHFGVGTLVTPYALVFNLHYAVDIFFIISGLVLASSNYYPQQPITAKEFFIKRLARLYPLHMLTLGIMIGLAIYEGTQVSWQTVMSHSLLLHNTGLTPIDDSFNFPSWSISVELWCTLLFFYLTKTIRSRTFTFDMLIVIVMLCYSCYPNLLLVGSYQEFNVDYVNNGMLRGLIGTALGVILYLGLQSSYAKLFFNNRLIGVLCGLMLVAYFFLEMPLDSTSVFYLCSFLFIGTLAYRPTFMHVLSMPVCVWLGAISYSIYLLHIPLYHTMQMLLGNDSVKGITGKLILVPTLLILSTMVYHWVEKPCQKWLRGKSLRAANKSPHVAI